MIAVLGMIWSHQDLQRPAQRADATQSQIRYGKRPDKWLKVREANTDIQKWP